MSTFPRDFLGLLRHLAGHVGIPGKPLLLAPQLAGRKNTERTFVRERFSTLPRRTHPCPTPRRASFPGALRGRLRARSWSVTVNQDAGGTTRLEVNCQTTRLAASRCASGVTHSLATAARVCLPVLASSAARSAARRTSSLPTPQDISATTYTSAPVPRWVPRTTRSARVISSLSAADKSPRVSASSS